MLLASPAFSAVLMLDFGPTVVTGADRTNSAYHTANPLFTDVSWNQVINSDPASLVWSDGTTAALTLNLGVTTTADGTTLLLASNPSGNNALGSNVNTGVYVDTSVGKDGIYTSNSNGNKRYVGFQLGGLEAGVYDVYVAARNKNSSGAYTQDAYAGVSSSAGDFVAPSLSQTGSVSFTGATDGTLAWVENGNYMRLRLTLGAGDYLNFAVTGTGSELRGFLNAVQVVSVPEPSAVLLCGLGFFGIALLRGRHRSGRTN